MNCVDCVSRGYWQMFQVYCTDLIKKVLMAFLGATGRCSGCTVLIFECVDGVSRGYWQMFQVYMLIIILILPTIIMTFAYSSISIEVIRFNHKIATIQGMQIKALQLNPIYMTHRTLLAFCIKRCEIKNIESATARLFYISLFCLCF